jgi:hypothetical protein
MNETREESGATGQQIYPRRRFLGVFGGLVAGLWGLAPMVDLRAGQGGTGPREDTLKEADYYRPHDLAG